MLSYSPRYSRYWFALAFSSRSDLFYSDSRANAAAIDARTGETIWGRAVPTRNADPRGRDGNVLLAFELAGG